MRVFDPKLIEEAEGRGLELLKVDIDGPNGHLVDEYEASSVPTVLVLSVSKPVDKIVSAQFIQCLRARLDVVEEGIVSG